MITHLRTLVMSAPQSRAGQDPSLLEPGPRGSPIDVVRVSSLAIEARSGLRRTGRIAVRDEEMSGRDRCGEAAIGRQQNARRVQSRFGEWQSTGYPFPDPPGRSSPGSRLGRQHEPRERPAFQTNPPPADEEWSPGTGPGPVKSCRFWTGIGRLASLLTRLLIPSPPWLARDEPVRAAGAAAPGP